VGLSFGDTWVGVLVRGYCNRLVMLVCVMDVMNRRMLLQDSQLALAGIWMVCGGLVVLWSCGLVLFLSLVESLLFYGVRVDQDPPLSGGNLL